MLAPTHVTSSALLFAAGAPFVSALGAFPLDAPTYIAGILVCGGAGLLPDIDMNQSRVARSFGPLTQGLATVAGWLAGGHRKQTHTLWFAIAAFVAVAYQQLLFQPVGWLFSFLGGILPATIGERFDDWAESFQTGSGGVFLLTWYLVTMCMLCINIPILSGMAKSRRVGGFAVTPVVIGLAVAWWTISNEPAGGFEGFGYWLPWAVALGCIAHCLGDMCTTGLVPFFMVPIRGMGKNFRIGIPFLGNTSSARESLACVIFGIAIVPVAYFGIQKTGGFELPGSLSSISQEATSAAEGAIDSAKETASKAKSKEAKAPKG